MIDNLFVFDFDDTLATSKSQVISTSPDGTRVLIKFNCWEKFIDREYTL